MANQPKKTVKKALFDAGSYLVKSFIVVGSLPDVLMRGETDKWLDEEVPQIFPDRDKDAKTAPQAPKSGKNAL